MSVCGDKGFSLCPPCEDGGFRGGLVHCSLEGLGLVVS